MVGLSTSCGAREPACVIGKCDAYANVYSCDTAHSARNPFPTSLQKPTSRSLHGPTAKQRQEIVFRVKELIKSPTEPGVRARSLGSTAIVVASETYT